MPTNAVLITGASTGLGRATVDALVRRGLRVYAGVRSPADAQSLAQAPDLAGHVRPLILDVTVPDTVHAAFEAVRADLGNDGLFAVIANAGIVVPGPVEFVSDRQWFEQFDVNLFGVVRVVRAALPLLRSAVARLGAGRPRILLVSSIGGRIAQPINAPYSASKFALSGLGDSLRLELRSQGIGVSIIEPGAISTAIWGKGDQQANRFHADHPARAHYAAEIDGLSSAARKFAKAAVSAPFAAERLTAALLAPSAPRRVLIGPDARIGGLLRTILPDAAIDAIVARQLSLPAPPRRGQPLPR